MLHCGAVNRNKVRIYTVLLTKYDTASEYYVIEQNIKTTKQTYDAV